MNAVLRDSVRIAACFDLGQTLDCGQCFRWEETGRGPDFSVWEGVALGHRLSIRQETRADGGGTLTFFCTEQEFETLWAPYFDLDCDYDRLRDGLSELSPVLREAAAFAPGIRILRQEPWEALCSFIISQNNNIPRIKGIISRFCALCGEELSPGVFAFPTPERVAGMDLDGLAPIRAGFRAKYILGAAKAVAGGEVDFAEIARSPVEFGRSELQKIYGVGPKVAECALLYGFHKTACFPMDVWMKRAMEVLLPDRAPEEFEEAAGLAQQYIFHYSRMHPELFKAGDTPNKRLTA